MALPMLPRGQLGKEATANCAVKTYQLWSKCFLRIHFTFCHKQGLPTMMLESFKGGRQACGILPLIYRYIDRGGTPQFQLKTVPTILLSLSASLLQGGRQNAIVAGNLIS